MSYKEFSSKNAQELSTLFTVNTSIPVKNPRREQLDLLLPAPKYPG